jgi:hypothetical protein
LVPTPTVFLTHTCILDLHVPRSTEFVRCTVAVL